MAGWATAVQNGRLRFYLAVILTATLGLVAVLGGFPPPIDFSAAAPFTLDFTGELRLLRLVSLFLICGTALAAASYVTIRGLWRWHLVCEVKKRRALRRARAGLSASRSEPETPS